MCIGQSQSPSPPPPPFHLGIHTFVLYIYACISPVQISSCVPFFYLYVLIYDVFLFLTYCCALRVLAPESVWSACLMVMTRIYSLSLWGPHWRFHCCTQAWASGFNSEITKSFSLWSLAFEAYLPESWTDRSLGVCGLRVCCTPK